MIWDYIIQISWGGLVIRLRAGYLIPRHASQKIKPGAHALPLGRSIDRLRLFRSLFLRSTQGVETFHQAALEAGGFVRVDDALACRFVQLADGLQNGLFRFGSVLCKCGASLIDGCASRTADISVTQTALLVLAVPFDLRLNVSQGLPLSFTILICACYFGTGAVFYMMLAEMSRKFTAWR